MHLPRKWNNSDLVSSQLLHLFFNFKTSNPNSKPYIFIDRKINHKAAFQTNQMMLFMFSFVFMIVAMAIGTKRLAFGVTIFAFVLLVFEYVVNGRFSSCSSGFQLIIRSCFPLLATSFRFERHDRINSCEISDDSSSDHSTVCKEREEQNVMDVKKMTCGGEEVINDGESEHLRTVKRRSRREILKGKIIRRLVPKKFRHSKYSKGNEEKFEDRFTTCVKVMEGESSVGSLTIRQVISEVESDSEESNYSNFSVRPDDLSWHSDHSLKSESDSVIFRSSKSAARGGKSGYMTMLMVVVLAGLMGGRILSFLLAIGYICIFKYISTVKKSSADPIFASTVRYTD